MYDLLLKIHDDFRIFPKLMAIAILWLHYTILAWATKGWTLDIVTLQEWQLGQFALLVSGQAASMIAFAKWYMTTGHRGSKNVDANQKV